MAVRCRLNGWLFPGSRTLVCSVNFTVRPVRVQFATDYNREVPAGGQTNLLRGAFGAALRQLCACKECRGAANIGASRECFYQRFFKPLWPDGPSGYRQAPRPFVLRPAARAPFSLELVLFDLAPPWNLFEQALALVAGRLQRQLLKFDVAGSVYLPLTGEPRCGALRLEFVTPTEIKEAGAVLEIPHFAPLIRRLAERVQALGRLYQNWGADASLIQFAADPEDVKLLAWHWVLSDTFRKSASTGQIHSVGGFTGWAEYSGPLGAFLPLLEIGSWTGVGRQTVWGKGEIRVTSFTERQLPFASPK